MASVKSTLMLQDKMSQKLKDIDAASKKTGNSFDMLNSKLTSLQNSMNTAGSIFRGVFSANLAQQGIGMITSQIDDAISRFDTINNYANVMAGLGFGTEESQASIERLKTGLDGLPTALDDAVLSVQRFAAVNENIKASTEMTLALNDALAAGGTPAATQAAALEQISQAYAKGKFDAIEYKTMMTAMPAQLKQVAKAMGYTSTAVGGDFYNALQKGEIGMNSMMNTMMQLDKQTNGFHDQALKATSGIKTAFTNMKTSITRGITKLIYSINSALEKADLPSIQQIIKDIGTGVENALTVIGTVVSDIINLISPVVTFLKDNIDTVCAVLEALIIVYVAWQAVTLAVTAAQWLLNVAMAANPVGLIIILVAALIAILILLWETSDGFRKFVTKMYAEQTKGIYTVYNAAVTVYNGLMDALQGLTDGAYNAFSSLIDMFAQTAISMINSGSSIMQMFDKLISAYNQIASSVGGPTLPLITDNLNSVIADIKTSAERALDNVYIGLDFEGRKLDLIDETAYDNIENLMDSLSDFTIGGYLSDALDGVSSAIKNNTSDLSSLLNDVINPSVNSGGGGGGASKAIQTTSNDKLLSDEDIQLLLDIATRDYKLNYQQVTPNITLTFGDIRETADVDELLDEVATRLEEIYDSNLEVASAR